MAHIQRSLFSGNAPEYLDLDAPYFSSQLITYLGNKRSLLSFLNKGFAKVKKILNKEKLVILDGFAGSGSVSRLLKYYAKVLYANDLENYSFTLNRCYLANRSEINVKKLEYYIDILNDRKLSINKPGFISLNYSPKDDMDIKSGERVFYTSKNAQVIDNIRKLIDKDVPEKYRVFCLASLLVEASIHTNTSGVFKGFHKKNGIGHFGGKGENALSRIKKEITLEVPVFSDIECKVVVLKKDINRLVKDTNLPEFDLVYLDPPYNQHPYGSNYFMLNLINDYKNFYIQDGVSGITRDWNKSVYNKRHLAEEAMDQLLKNTRAKFIVISYNDEGIIPVKTFKSILSKHGKWKLMSSEYNTYRGSRNLRNRNIRVKEMMWVLRKK
ncbi:MAG: DNA adenine methylase [Candidatus Saganbacteria bacterium]|nr:DNA adenine methylase [Candidatus Saganbacteria bacterium]